MTLLLLIVGWAGSVWAAYKLGYIVGDQAGYEEAIKSQQGA